MSAHRAGQRSGKDQASGSPQRQFTFDCAARSRTRRFTVCNRHADECGGPQEERCAAFPLGGHLSSSCRTRRKFRQLEPSAWFGASWAEPRLCDRANSCGVVRTAVLSASLPNSSHGRPLPEARLRSQSSEGTAPAQPVRFRAVGTRLATALALKRASRRTHEGWGPCVAGLPTLEHVFSTLGTVHL